MGKIIKKDKVVDTRIITDPIFVDDTTGEELEMAEAHTEPVNWEGKCMLLQNNLDSAYAKIRELERQLSEREIKERSTDMLITQAVSVFSNTVNLAIKNKNI
jgi:hypothetical protein